MQAFLRHHRDRSELNWTELRQFESAVQQFIVKYVLNLPTYFTGKILLFGWIDGWMDGLFLPRTVVLQKHDKQYYTQMDKQALL